MTFGTILLLVLSSEIALSQTIIPANYSNAFRPTQPDGKPLEILTSIKINGIQEIDPKKMSVTLHLYLRVMWRDDRLIFPAEYVNASSPGSDSLSLSRTMLSQLWTPDHFFRNTRSIKTFKLLQEASGIKLSEDKLIYTSSMYDIELGCPMSFRNFPFDTQECLFHMGSFLHTINEVRFGWHKLGLSVDSKVQKQLEDFDFRISASNETVCPCPGCFPDKTPCIQIFLTLKRRYMVHLLSYFIPSSLFVIVSWASFFWPADVIPGRTVLVITALLTVSSLYASSRYDTPKTSYVKAIDAWMFFSIIIGVTALFEYAIVLQWMKKKEKAQANQAGKMSGGGVDLAAKYQSYQDRTELVGIIGTLIVIFLFNVIYWPYFL